MERLVMDASTVTNQSLDAILRNKLELPEHRIAAAMLTVAFQIRKDGQLNRREAANDDMIKDEIASLYYGFIGVTDPQTGHELKRRSNG
jgi:hypothetical protein